MQIYLWVSIFFRILACHFPRQSNVAHLQTDYWIRSTNLQDGSWNKVQRSIQKEKILRKRSDMPTMLSNTLIVIDKK